MDIYIQASMHVKDTAFSAVAHPSCFAGSDDSLGSYAKCEVAQGRAARELYTGASAACLLWTEIYQHMFINVCKL